MVDVRALLAEHERDLARRRPPVVDPDLVGLPVALVASAPTLAEKLEAGGAVVVPAWKLLRWLPKPPPFDDRDDVRIEPNGRFVVVERIPHPTDPTTITYIPRT